MERIARDIEQARVKYRPDKINVLFVAEAAPDALDRFFYYEDVPKADYLFLALMKELMPDKCRTYILFGRKPLQKQEMLVEFKQRGLYLMDLSPVPARMSIPESHAVEFVQKIRDMEEGGLLNKETPIIFLKKSVYDVLYEDLHNRGYNVIDARLPFPSCGQQKNFSDGFREVKRMLSV
ncbi:MAG: hypothetical protein IJZ70_07710 [Bacteroidales bacterium]|nr:hypothetical protein [Bacteroidales bacterium]